MGKSSFELLQELQKNKAKTGKKVKKTEKTEKSNDITDIVDPNDIDEVVGQIASISSDKKDSRQDKFLLYWLLGYSVRVAAITAGYSEGTSRGSNLYKVLKRPITRERLLQITNGMPEKYKALCRMRMGDVAEIESGVVKLMKDDPELALKHPQVLKQMKQAAGVLLDEVSPPPTVNIKSLKIMQNINLAACESRSRFLEDDPEDDSQEAYEVWLKKKELAGPEIIDAEVKEVSQEEGKE